MHKDDDEVRSTLTNWSLRDIKARGFGLEAYCQTPNCSIFFVFDLDALITRAGEDYILPEFITGMTCEACGGALKLYLAMIPPSD